MSRLNRRQKQCMNAIESTLKILRKKNYEAGFMTSVEDHLSSPSAILESSFHTLQDEGFSESEAQLFSLIPSLTRYTLREQFSLHPRIDKLSIAGEYLKTLFVGVSIEQFYILHLDASGRLIQCKMLQRGNVDETPFYLDHLLHDVIDSGASAVVISHNHPGGTLRPSNADIHCTLTAISALFPLGILLLDHIIIADDQAVSLRDNAFVPVQVWNGQDPGNPLLRNWLDIDS